jgi:hypothetical protein
MDDVLRLTFYCAKVLEGFRELYQVMFWWQTIFRRPGIWPVTYMRVLPYVRFLLLSSLLLFDGWRSTHDLNIDRLLAIKP